MAVPHVFAEPADCDDTRVVVRDGVAHHLLRVLRRGVGDRVTVADGTGAVRTAVIAAIDDAAATCAVETTAHVPPPSPRVRVVCGLPKGRKLDEVVVRLTELGVDEIVPAHTARSQIRWDGPRAERARQRWRAVARAAAEQSRRARLPVIAPVTTWTAAFTDVRGGVVCWEEATVSLRDAALHAPAGQITVGVGPEGGLTAAEVDGAGLPAVGLGRTILRAETAAVVAPAIVLHRLGRLG